MANEEMDQGRSSESASDSMDRNESGSKGGATSGNRESEERFVDATPGLGGAGAGDPGGLDPQAPIVEGDAPPHVERSQNQ